MTLTIVALVGASLLALSFAVYSTFTRAVWHQFDARLEQDAAAIALMVEEWPGEAWEIERGAIDHFERNRGPLSFEIWMPTGVLLARVPARSHELPPPILGAAPTHSDLTLGDGRTVRLYQAWMYPRQEEGERPSGARVGVAVTRDPAALLAAIATIRALLVGLTLGVVAVAALAAVIAARRALARVTRLSAEIASLDASSLGTRLELDGLPGELRPPFEKLNELLSRIETSFARERQLTSDTSHELRTPLAGLRSVLEVAASRDRAAPQYRAAIAEALAIVRQMGSLVDDVLELGAARNLESQGRREDVALSDLAASCFAPHARAARDRALRFENRIPASLRVSCEPDKLRIVLSNLLSNAVEYTETGGWITVESDPARALLVAVRDSGPPIPEPALDRIFDPFVRLDASRTGGGKHCGIGLALTRAVCERLGYHVAARNEPRGEVVFAVMAARASSDSHPAAALSPRAGEA